MIAAIPRREGLGAAAGCGKAARGRADPEGDRADGGAIPVDVEHGRCGRAHPGIGPGAGKVVGAVHRVGGAVLRLRRRAGGIPRRAEETCGRPNLVRS